MKTVSTIQNLAMDQVKIISHQGQLIFDEASFEFPMNRVVWLVSEAGAGKSLVLKFLNGLVQPQSGHLMVNGEVVQNMTFEEFLKYRLNMGYSFDFGGLIHNRTLLQNLLLPLEYHRVWSNEECLQKAEELMRTFGIWDSAHQRPSAVSGSIRKALCVARAFIHEPELLLLDDPTTGLRSEIKVKLKDLILKRRASGSLKHVFLTSEDFDFVSGLTDAVVEIDHGKLKSVAHQKGIVA